MIEKFGFQVKTRMQFGIGYSRGLMSFLSEKGYEHLVILVDEGVAKNSGYYKEVVGSVEAQAKSLTTEVLRGTEEPDYDYLDDVADRVRAIDKVDVVLGIGGGSCLDIAKAVAVLRTNSGKGISYRGFDMVLRPGVPTIAIPTTAGTGSEVTINAVFIDKKEMKKLGINGLYMNATYAILDAEWTMSCPSAVAVSAGMDALTHALESFMCNKANVLTRMFSKEAFRLLYSALPSLVDHPLNVQKRQELLLGSYLAGIALFNSGSGIAGAFSYPLGVHFRIPHGICGAVFLPSVVDFNVRNGYSDYSEFFDLIEQGSTYTAHEKAQAFSRAIAGLSRKLRVPEYLDQWGVTKSDVREVAKLLLPLQAAFDQNPVPFSADKDAYEMLAEHVRP